MHSLNDSLKLNLFHMGRSDYFKNHSNKLNFQNPSTHRILNTCLAHPPKIFSKFKTQILAAILSNRLQIQINQIKNTILSSVLANLVPSLVATSLSRSYSSFN